MVFHVCRTIHPKHVFQQAESVAQASGDFARDIFLVLVTMGNTSSVMSSSYGRTSPAPTSKTDTIGSHVIYQP